MPCFRPVFEFSQTLYPLMYSRILNCFNKIFRVRVRIMCSDQNLSSLKTICYKMPFLLAMETFYYNFTRLLVCSQHIQLILEKAKLPFNSKKAGHLKKLALTKLQ